MPSIFIPFLYIGFVLVSPTLCEAMEYNIVLRNIDNYELLYKIKGLNVLAQHRENNTIYDIISEVSGITNNIVALAHTEGFYNAIVSFDINPHMIPLCVNINHSLNTRFTVHSVIINTSSTHDITTLLPTEQDLNVTYGVTFATTTNVNKILQSIVSFFETTHNMNTTIDNYHLVVDKHKNYIDIYVDIYLTLPILIGDSISIIGNNTISEKCIYNILNLKNNEILSVTSIRSIKQKLIDSMLFEEVDVYPDYSTEYVSGEHNYVPLVVKVKESKHNSINIMANLSSSSLYPINLLWEFMIKFETRNLYGWGHMGSLSIIYTSPYKMISGKANANINSYDICTYFELIEGMCMAISMPGLQLYNEQKILLQSLFEQQGDIDSCEYLLEYVYIQKKTDKRLIASYYNDNLHIFKLAYKYTFPLSSSMLYRCNIQLLPTLILSSKTSSATMMCKLEADYKYTIHILEGIRLQSMVGGGYIFPLYKLYKKLIPNQELFFLGSSSVMRGYKINSIGASNTSINYGDKILQEPIGGYIKTTGSIELIFDVVSNVALLTFIDIGSVYDNINQLFTKSMFSSIGIGIRLINFGLMCEIILAFPMKFRMNIDDHVQIYLLVGTHDS